MLSNKYYWLEFWPCGVSESVCISLDTLLVERERERIIISIKYPSILHHFSILKLVYFFLSLSSQLELKRNLFSHSMMTICVIHEENEWKFLSIDKWKAKHFVYCHLYCHCFEHNYRLYFVACGLTLTKFCLKNINEWVMHSFNVT